MSEAQWKTQRPTLSRDNELVLEIWNFCDGWNPAAYPLAFAYYSVSDPEFVLTQLLVLRERIGAYRAAQQEPHGQ